MSEKLFDDLMDMERFELVAHLINAREEIQKRDELLEQAKLHVQFLSIASGIGVYEQWLKQYEELKR